MAQMNLVSTISLNEAGVLIGEIGSHVTTLLVGEPGIGKTSILKSIEAKLGDGYDYIYVDCPVKETQDIGMTMPNKDTQRLEYWVNELFKLDNNKPKVIMLDEMLKAPNLVKLIFTRLILERSVGDVALPEGSIVFATSNSVSDGLGDNIAGHLQNRLCMVNVRKPTAEEWTADYAIPHGVAPEVIAWVNKFSHALASYRDGGQDENPYIFNPKKMKGAFVSPRSLSKASFIVGKRHIIGEAVTMSALAGTIGESAARDMAAFLSVADKLPSHEKLIADPEGIEIPDDVAAILVLLYSLVARTDSKEEVETVMKFVRRLSEEMQAIFVTSFVRAKREIAFKCGAITSWVRDNAKYF